MKTVRLSLYAAALCAGILLCGLDLSAAESDITEQQLRELKRQNQLLQQQLDTQKKQIDDLTEKVSALRQDRQENEPPPAPAALPEKKGFSLGKVHISGEGGVGFFRSEGRGPFPNSEFRVDEAKLFVEAPIFKDIYFFTELNLITRESPDDLFRLGELYLDFENLSRFWNRDRQLNLRVGRLDIPFGEEYLCRDAIDNPLISHSLSDIWGVDEGIELYGAFGRLQYTVAVQNGGHPELHDYDPDKSIAVRLAYDPTRNLHFSASAMRTGALTKAGDQFSELWFGNAYVMAIGGAGTTKFQANVLEADAQVRWSQGHLKGAGGYLKYDDNGPANVQREVYYYYLEALQHVTPRLYAAARWSQMLAPAGYPIAGDGSWGDYFFGVFTRDLWRLTLGAGYKVGSNLLLKGEYTFNQGRAITGEKRTQENLVAAQAAFSF